MDAIATRPIVPPPAAVATLNPKKRITLGFSRVETTTTTRDDFGRLQTTTRSDDRWRRTRTRMRRAR
jgi:hypothetical protein